MMVIEKGSGIMRRTDNESEIMTTAIETDDAETIGDGIMTKKEEENAMTSTRNGNGIRILNKKLRKRKRNKGQIFPFQAN